MRGTGEGEPAAKTPPPAQIRAPGAAQGEKQNRRRPGCIQGPTFFNQDQREGCYLQVRFSDNASKPPPVGPVTPLLTAPVELPTTYIAPVEQVAPKGRHHHRWRSGYHLVQQTNIAIADTLEASPQSDQGEVQELHHPSLENISDLSCELPSQR